jgi:coenzyme F420-reducing hydrogenase alpha subunit
VTEPAEGERTLRVEALARVEGEGAMHVEIRDGHVQQVQLRIYEPPRFFEALLRGRRFTEPPDITARICGICPVAYQLSACNAIEAACGVVVDGPLADLRRLLYCGEWIESHGLHIYLLHAPDFLGYQSGIELALHDRATVQKGLDLKKIGNEILEVVGGRAVHPVNVRVGGFYRVPTRGELQGLVPRLERARELALETVRWVATFDFPEIERDWELVALHQPDAYAITDGRLVSTTGLDIGPDELDDHIVEEHVAHSNALHARLLARGPYLVGPLARVALSFDQLAPVARAAATEVGFGPDNRNPFRSIVARAVEVVHACEEALAIIDGYEPPELPAVVVEPRAGVGSGWTEAPRGMLWHQYELTEDGSIAAARIIPPTSQNQASIEADLFHFVEENLDLDDDELGRRAEQVIRNHDPCISCATHFLQVTVDRT